MTQVQAKTRVKISRNKVNVHISVECQEPLQVILSGNVDGYAVWNGDNVEIFFGAMGKHPWYRHFVVGAGGGRHNIYASLKDWSAQTSIREHLWKADLTIPIRLFGSYEDGLRFNILRQRTVGKELQTWSNIVYGHDVELFGKIPFDLPPDFAVHGPWLFQPETTEIGIGWETAGTCFATLEYREKGTNESITIKGSIVNAVRHGNGGLHKTWLSGLKQNTEYEYSTGGTSGSFRTLNDKPSDFSFFLTADLHDRPKKLAELLKNPETQDCDFAVYLGDMLTSSLDKSTYYDAFLDVSVENWKKPFVYARGNHEYRGRATKAYFDLFGTRNDKGYFAFIHGGVFFIVLDLEGDSPRTDTTAYAEEQKDFLLKVNLNPAFRKADFRIVLGHVPPLSPQISGGKQIVEVLKVLPQGTIDLFIGGHNHCYCYAPAGRKNIFSTNPKYDGMSSFDLDFPLIVCAYGGLVKVERGNGKLYVRILDGVVGKNPEILVRQKRTTEKGNANLAFESGSSGPEAKWSCRIKK